VADARGTDKDKVGALLETGGVHTTLGSVLDGFPGLRMSSEAVVTRMEDKRMCNAVAVTIGNRHLGTAKAVDCHLSAQQLNAALEGRGLRVEAPWIDQPGGEPMLRRLRQVLANQVLVADDGFVFCFCGHGGAIHLMGNDNVPTSYQAIIDAIDIEKLRGRPKLVVFDCCRGNLASELGQLRLPKDMILARSTALSTQAFEQQSVGNVYSNRLAAAISSHAAAHSVVDLLKLTQGKVHGLRTPTPQVAHVELTLGAYHLFLGGLLC